MSINYFVKVNEHSPATPISGEIHLVGIVGTATFAHSTIRLIQVPQPPSPLSTVFIPGYTEVSTFSGTNQFIVDYTGGTGVITFSSDVLDGTSVSVSYNGLGSEFAAEDLNELQNPLGTVAAQTVVYSWPSAPTVSWSLAPNIVLPSNITNVSTDDFTFPRDVIVTRNLITPDVISTSVHPASTGVVRLANITDSISWRNAGNTGDLALTVNASNQLTFNGTPIELGTLTSAHLFVGNGSNVATDTAITGDISITNMGVVTISSGSITNVKVASGTFSNITGVGSQTQDLNMNSHFIHNVTDPVSLQDAVTLNYASTHYSPAPGSGDIQFNVGGFFSSDNNLYWKNSTHQMGIGTNTPDASALVDMTSTMFGFLPPRMTTTQRDAINGGTFATGLIVYNTTDNQWEGWNGSSWVILG